MSTGINLKNVRPNPNNPQGNFDLSHRVKYDFSFGQLIPSLCMPVMPGDDISISFDQLVRMAPFVSQVYQDFVVCNDFFFVPNRLLWKDFYNFMTAGYDGKHEYVHPYLRGDLLTGSQVYGPGNSAIPKTHHHIFNYLDVPNSYFAQCHEDSLRYDISAFPLAAYMRTFMDYMLPVGHSLSRMYEIMLNNGNCLLTEGDNSIGLSELYGILASSDLDFTPSDLFPDVDKDAFDRLFAPLYRLYPLDYFTQARPDPQLGPVMTIPLELRSTDLDGTNTFKLVGSGASSTTTGTNVHMSTTQGSDQLTFFVGNNQSEAITVNGSVFNNVATINDFYSAARIQELLTLYNFSGFMPKDTLAAEFGVEVSDKSLQRSQFLHHHQEVVSIGEVFSNNVDTSSAPEDSNSIPGVGTAIGKVSTSNRGFRFRSGEEFGFLLCLTSLYPKSGYNQGLPRIYRQLDRFDYPHPLLSELGMESIRKSELFIGPVSSVKEWDEDFAYNPRYSSYKVGIDRDRGEFAGNLQYMTDARRLDSQYCVFNDHFCRVIPSINHLNRPFNVSSYLPVAAPLFSDMNFRISAHRQLPYYGLPRY